MFNLIHQSQAVFVKQNLTLSPKLNNFRLSCHSVVFSCSLCPSPNFVKLNHGGPFSFEITSQCMNIVSNLHVHEAHFVVYCVFASVIL